MLAMPWLQGKPTVSLTKRKPCSGISYTCDMSDTEPLRDQPQTVGQALLFCSEALQNSDVFFGHGTDSAWDESVQLVLSVAGLPLDSSDDVLPDPLSPEGIARLRSLLGRRIEEHIPLPYLLGRAWFAGLEYRCDPRAIIPRSPIAELILAEFRPWYSGPEPSRILDLCCGGGCIGLATAHYFPAARVDLLDIDSAALELAQENAAALELLDRVSIIQSDLFDELGDGRYDLILSNPPYVDAADLAAMPAEYHHEPENSLGSGADGLALTRRILSCAETWLRDTGLLVVEVGNSWTALEEAYPEVPFTWLEFEHGGEGVFAISAPELQEYRTKWRQLGL
jgi:ribosomal protein L3 glutamine methyltransferase|tara:strand:- start:2580 stop:3596 length:1017 start_codon:yes stop_codon:yes gene_type:complete